jgi:hypothetical protein
MGTRIESSSKINITSDQTLHAKWIPLYTITFDSNGGTDMSSRRKLIKNSSSYGALPTPTKNSYEFGGWWTAMDGIGIQIESSSYVNITMDQTLYAKWSYKIGAIGPAGGFVFYDKGAYSDGWRYLEAAPLSTESASKLWGGCNTNVGGTGFSIGTGKDNTEKIVAKYRNAEPYGNKTDYAAKLCLDLVYGGSDDWFLPSKDELSLIYLNLYTRGIGGFSGGYWSSSEAKAYDAWVQYFDGGGQYDYYKYNGASVRAVRAF